MHPECAQNKSLISNTLWVSMEGMVLMGMVGYGWYLTWYLFGRYYYRWLYLYSGYRRLLEGIEVHGWLL